MSSRHRKMGRREPSQFSAERDAGIHQMIVFALEDPDELARIADTRTRIVQALELDPRPQEQREEHTRRVLRALIASIDAACVVGVMFGMSKEGAAECVRETVRARMCEINQRIVAGRVPS